MTSAEEGLKTFYRHQPGAFEVHVCWLKAASFKATFLVLQGI
jgi:hypothetical protein